MQAAAVAAEHCPQLEEEPGRDDPVTREQVANLARAGVARDAHDDAAVAVAVEGLEQFEQEPGAGDRQHEHNRRDHATSDDRFSTRSARSARRMPAACLCVRCSCARGAAGDLRARQPDRRQVAVAVTVHGHWGQFGDRVARQPGNRLMAWRRDRISGRRERSGALTGRRVNRLRRCRRDGLDRRGVDRILRLLGGGPAHKSRGSRRGLAGRSGDRLRAPGCVATRLALTARRLAFLLGPFPSISHQLNSVGAGANPSRAGSNSVEAGSNSVGPARISVARARACSQPSSR